jgi:uncharacterized membrane protein
VLNIQTGLVIFLHDFFTAIWVGGLFMITLTTLPALKNILGHSPESEKTMDAIMRRHSKWVYISIVGLIITGVMLARGSNEFSGLFNFSSVYNSLLSIKHILVILMVGLALIRSLGFKSLAKAPDMKKKKMSLLMMHLNALAGLLVLFLSALTASFS